MDFGLWKACIDLASVFVVPVALICLIVYVVKASQYKKTDYAKQTHFPFWHTLFNLGKRGEYFTYDCLSKLQGRKRFVFNCYIPKEDGTTTEIDVLMLHESGIYVFESKNYSGWIFGTETQKMWTQSLPAGKGRSRKEHFLNPIIQNKGHLKWLKEYLGNDTLPFYSYIVFSERCTLKDIRLNIDTNHHVVKRNDLAAAVKKNINDVGTKLSNETIDELFDELYPLSQVDAAQKQKHIDQIQEKFVQSTAENNDKTNENAVPATDIAPKLDAESVLTNNDSGVNDTSASNKMSESNNVPVGNEQPLINEADAMICPKCGGKLVKRISRRGEHTGSKFWGCSNYPKCRYIRPID